jgi:hypothetical protein
VGVIGGTRAYTQDAARATAVDYRGMVFDKLGHFGSRDDGIRPSATVGSLARCRSFGPDDIAMA